MCMILLDGANVFSLKQIILKNEEKSCWNGSVNTYTKKFEICDLIWTTLKAALSVNI